MRSVVLFSMAILACSVSADDRTVELPLITKPDKFQTLVNPNCSHCRDEATLRAGDLQDTDRVLCWIRGYSDGGAIPHRFFLNRFRVISDSYGVFVYDSDSGFVRGYEPSYEFSFHGWRNGVMVMQRKDGTLFSCLSGEAFAGPGKGTRLKPVPTLVSDWGFWLKHYPDAVAYRMFDQYQSVPLPTDPNEESVRTRGLVDARLAAEEPILGVSTGQSTKAYPLSVLAERGFIADEIDGEPIVILWEPESKSAAAYHPIASQPRRFRAPAPDRNGVSPPDAGVPFPSGARELPAKPVTLKHVGEPGLDVTDQESGSHWDITGRAVDGALKGWTLTWLDSTQVKWFAWSAENPATEIYESASAGADYKPLTDQESWSAGPLGNRDVSVRHFAILKAIDFERQRVTLQVEGETALTERTLESGAEVWCDGWWGRLDQFVAGDRVWVWFSSSRPASSASIALLSDEFSEQDFYGAATVSQTGKHASDAASVTLTMGRGGKPVSRTIVLTKPEFLTDLKVNDPLYFQTTDSATRLAVTPVEFEQRRSLQMSELVQRWTDEGLPGTLVFRHDDRQQLDVMLDHESMFWGRTLRTGDTVAIRLNTTLTAVVRRIQPWRERTQVLLQCESLIPSDLAVDQRILVKLNSVPTGVNLYEPPGMNQSATAEERIEWLMSGIYCTCGMHDMCAGHFYTLAACDAIGDTPCGLAKRTRAEIAERIAEGLTNRQIFEELLKERGPKLLRPHMSP